jgi:hypothetical protein
VAGLVVRWYGEVAGGGAVGGGGAVEGRHVRGRNQGRCSWRGRSSRGRIRGRLVGEGGGVAPSSYCVMGHTIGGPFFYPFEACGLRELSSKNHPSPQRA